jgi:hypothetical protein
MSVYIRLDHVRTGYSSLCQVRQFYARLPYKVRLFHVITDEARLGQDISDCHVNSV